MGEVHDLFSSFNAGELSPRLASRVDFAKFKSGLAEMTNFIPLSEGGAMRRSGSRYIADATTSTVRSRLKRFEFSTTQAYVIEMGNQVFKFFRNQGSIVSQDITASIANGTFDSDISSWDDVSAGGGSRAWNATGRMDLIFSTTEGHAEQEVTNALAAEHIVKFRVYGAPGDSVILQIGTATGGTQIKSFTAFVGFHTIAFTATAANFFLQFKGNSSKTVQVDDVSLIDDTAISLVTPYLEADLPTVEGPQSADILYLFHADHPAYKLERRGHTTWSLVEVNWIDGPYGDINSTSTTLTPSAISGKSINITASSIIGINGDQGFLSTDIGRLVRINNPVTGTDWGYARIVSITSTTIAVADVGRSFGTATANVNWKLGAWSETTGYPSVAGFFEQRMFIANTANQPQTFWASQSADFENHTPDSAPVVKQGSVTAVGNDGGGNARFTTSSPHDLTTGQKITHTGMSDSVYNVTDTDITVVDSTKYDVAVSFTATDTGSYAVENEFDGTVEDDDALDFTISADDVNAIFWISAGEDTLAIGTAGGEWVPSSVGAVLTPSDIAVRRQVTSKSAQIQPVRIDNVVLFVQRAKRKIREFGFAFEIDGFQSVDMTRLAQHITRPGIVEMAFAEEPESQVFAVREDGKLLSMTFRRKEDVVGWSRFVLGGQFAGGNAVTATDISFTLPDTIESVALEFGKYKVGDILLISGTALNDFSDIGLLTIESVADDGSSITTVEQTVTTEDAGASMTLIAMSDSVVESVVSIPGTNGSGQVQDSTGRDEVWITVKRTVNGATVRFIEMFERSFEDDGSDQGDDQEDAYYSDSLLTYDSTSTTTITGLTHLEGETVKILADGATHDDKVVSSGSITLDIAAKVVQVGLGYLHRLETLRLEGGNPVGTAIGKIKRIDFITFVILNAQTLRWGPNLDNMVKVDFREVEDAMDSASQLFTGNFSKEFDGDWDRDPRIFIENDDPTSFTLLALSPEIRLNPIK